MRALGSNVIIGGFHYCNAIESNSDMNPMSRMKEAFLDLILKGLLSPLESTAAMLQLVNQTDN